MSGNPAIVTPPRPTRRLVSPVAFKKERDSAEVLYNGGPRRENSHGLSINADASTPSTISMPKIDSCILGRETLEQREKFTVSNTTGISILLSFSARWIGTDSCLLLSLYVSCTRLR